MPPKPVLFAALWIQIWWGCQTQDWVGSTDFHSSRDHTLAGPPWEGFRESRRCSRDTYPESYITEFILTYEDNRGSTFALRRSTLDSGLGGQRGKPQNERQHSLSQFTRGEKPILVATDVAAR